MPTGNPDVVPWSANVGHGAKRRVINYIVVNLDDEAATQEKDQRCEVLSRQSAR